MAYCNEEFRDNDIGHPYANPVARENPAFQSRYLPDRDYPDQSIEMLTYPDQVEDHEMQAIHSERRNQMRKASSRGIDNILLEMPSRTLGRKSGRHSAELASANVSSHSSYSRHMQQYALTHQDAEANEDASDPAMLLYNEIAQRCGGGVPNSEIRSLPVNMKMKRKIKKQANSDREQRKAKKIGKFEMWRYNMSIRSENFRDGLRRRMRSPRLWSYHLKQVEGHFGSGVSSYFIFLRGLFFLSFPSFILNFAFISLPQVLDAPERTDNLTFTGEELLTGANWLSQTILYYGYYTNGTIAVLPPSVYKMPLAYLLATAGYFLLCLLWLSRVTASSFRENYIEGKVSYSNFIGRTFCAWDYGITSKTVAALHRKIINTDLKEVLAEKLRKEEKRSSLRTCELYTMRIFTWLIFFGLVGGSMTAIYYVNDQFLEDLQSATAGTPVLRDILLALIVSALNLVIPIIINYITSWENYSNPRVELYIAVSRNFLLKVGLLGIICTFWISNNTDVIEEECWETLLGQEAYRLIVIDFLFSIIFVTFCAEFLRHMFSRFCCKSLEKAEFSIVNNVMDLIYGQTLCWIGVFFSPLLALIVCIKYFLMFYVKKVSVMQNCQAAKKRWRAAQSSTIFNGLLLLAFILSAIFIAVVVFREVPSKACGPFRGLDRAYSVVVREFDALVGSSDTQWFAVILRIVTSVWFLSAVNIVLAVLIVMRRSKVQGLAALGKALRQQIILEGKDKMLLLKWLQELSNQEGGGGDGSGPPKKPNNHRIPILSPQRPPSAPSTPSRPPSGMDYGEPMRGNVLTHVDPEHASLDHYVNSSPVARRRHHDPVVKRALESKQRPRTVYDVRTEDVMVHANDSPAQRYSYPGPIELEFIDDILQTDSESERSGTPPNDDYLAPSEFQGNVYMQSNF